MTSRVLIVVFDALRPEFVTPGLMPALHGFAQRGAWFTRARSTYPTETRVNQSAVITGCLPRRHGITGNAFVADDLQPGLLMNSGDDAMLEPAFAAGPVLTMPTIGQRLVAAGRSFAALSAGTPGGGRLINWSAVRDSSVRLAMRRPDACVPAGLFDRIVGRIGPLPDYDLPATEWITWAVDAYLHVIEKEIVPDAMLLWLCEPDETFHWKGIGSPDAQRTIAHADAEFGRILAAHGQAIEAGEMHVIALSDHGQISLRGARMDLAGKMRAAGFSVRNADDPSGESLLGVGSAGGIWMPDSAQGRIADLAEWLREQPWCGPLFTRAGLADTLPSAEICLDHPRAPDISVVFRSTDDENVHGIAGMTAHDAPYPEGGGCHGGLHPRELHTVLTIGGQSIAQGVRETPAGTIDVLPTTMELMGVAVPDDIDGVSLLRPDSGLEAGVAQHERILISPNAKGPRTHLSVTDFGSTRYLNGAWIEG